MTNNKQTDWGIVLMGVAAAFFVAVVVVIVGGWAFAWAWNTTIVPVFSTIELTTVQGIAAMLLLWLSGWALGLRRNQATKGS